MKLITVIGPTASGKTALAVALAQILDREIISADSRQVYRGMDIGTGKDLREYGSTPYHLIDICAAGEKYNLFEYQKDFLHVYNDMLSRGAEAILCGGSGMYVDAVVSGYELCEVAPDHDLRAELENKTIEELSDILSSYKSQHNKSDIDTKKRAIRAIEIARHYSTHPEDKFDYPEIDNIYIGISLDRDIRRERITRRLHQRLKEGMVEEVQYLLNNGVTPEDLIFYGLEYKFVTQYIVGELKYDEMVSGLENAIHQFAKRQMTWFRSMERKGAVINWIDGNGSLEDMTHQAIDIIKKNI